MSKCGKAVGARVGGAPSRNSVVGRTTRHWLMARARKTHHPFTLTACESYLVKQKLEFARAKRSGGFRRGALASDSCTVILSDFFETRARAVAI